MSRNVLITLVQAAVYAAVAGTFSFQLTQASREVGDLKGRLIALEKRNQDSDEYAANTELEKIVREVARSQGLKNARVDLDFGGVQLRAADPDGIPWEVGWICYSAATRHYIVTDCRYSPGDEAAHWNTPHYDGTSRNDAIAVAVSRLNTGGRTRVIHAAGR